MNIRKSFISTRKPKDIHDESIHDDEEEYYKWRIRQLNRNIRDIKNAILKIRNINGL